MFSPEQLVGSRIGHRNIYTSKIVPIMTYSMPSIGLKAQICNSTTPKLPQFADHVSQLRSRSRPKEQVIPCWRPGIWHCDGHRPNSRQQHYCRNQIQRKEPDADQGPYRTVHSPIRGQSQVLFILEDLTQRTLSRRRGQDGVVAIHL